MSQIGQTAIGANGNFIDVPLAQTVTDGTDTVSSVAQTTFVGATISGTSPNATVTVNPPQFAIVAGAAAGPITVTGITAADTLLMVLAFPGAGTTVTDVELLTLDFTISAANTITGSISTSGSKLLVQWVLG